jgi:hypothetical protein
MLPTWDSIVSCWILILLLVTSESAEIQPAPEGSGQMQLPQQQAPVGSGQTPPAQQPSLSELLGRITALEKTIAEERIAMNAQIRELEKNSSLAGFFLF